MPLQPLLERYGMTEIGMALSNPYEGRRVAGTVGQPLPGVTVCISTLPAGVAGDASDERHDGDRNLSCSGQEASHTREDSGEIRVKGPCLFKEYWQRPEATTDAFDENGFFRTGEAYLCCGSVMVCRVALGVRHIGRGDADVVAECWAAEIAGDTGDTVTIEGDEYYRVLGRTSVDIIKSGGFKISALSIENVLLEHPQVRGAVVLGVPDSMFGERIVCVCELEEASELKFAELVSWASDRLPPYELPRDMLTLPQIPRNAMGKVNKVEVRALFLAQTMSSQ